MIKGIEWYMVHLDPNTGQPRAIELQVSTGQVWTWNGGPMIVSASSGDVINVYDHAAGRVALAFGPRPMARRCIEWEDDPAQEDDDR